MRNYNWMTKLKINKNSIKKQEEIKKNKDWNKKNKK
jgi:hypothetical protein